MSRMPEFTTIGAATAPPSLPQDLEATISLKPDAFNELKAHLGEEDTQVRHLILTIKKSGDGDGSAVPTHE